MKRAGYLAWLGLAGLLLIAAIFLTGGVIYQSNAMWAGMIAALAQALVVGLSGWGILLARQNAELDGYSTASIPAQPLSMISPDSGTVTDTPSSRPLETGFQRLVVGIAAFILLAGSVIAGWVIYSTVAWARANPDRSFPIAGKQIDELALVIGLGCAGLYVMLYWMTRVKRDTRGFGDATSSNFTIGLAGMIAIGVAVLLGYFQFAYAAEAAGIFMALLLLLQGVELLVNSMRSYSGIEELDQEAVDLDKLPLVPMLSSVWLSSVKMLFAQSVGLSGKRHGERSVIGRMMPRALVAVIVIAIAMSCLRVVPAGNVAVLERLGYAGKDANGHLSQDALLKPGLHVTMPWPIDQLVMIPTDQLQFLGVGSDLHASKAMEGVDFQFWRFRPGGEPEEATEYITGEPNSPQLLETYVAILWRVKEPAKFYDRLSHSDFYEKGGGETVALPIFQALVQQSAEFAVTRTFGIHTLDQIMTKDRREVETHCKTILQQKLEQLDSGIEIVDLTIKDVHPPEGLPDQADETMPRLGDDPFINRLVQMRRGPASSYENVISMREMKEMLITNAQGIRIQLVNDANGWAKSEISRSNGYRADKIGKAQGEAARMTSMMGAIENMPADQRSLMQELARKQTLYTSLKDVLTPVKKIVVDRGIDPPQIWESPNQARQTPAPQQQ